MRLAVYLRLFHCTLYVYVCTKVMCWLSCDVNYRMSACFLMGEEDEGGQYIEREARVLSGVVEFVLPRVGSHVQTLDLAHGKAVSNAIVSSYE